MSCQAAKRRKKTNSERAHGGGKKATHIVIVVLFVVVVLSPVVGEAQLLVGRDVLDREDGEQRLHHVRLVDVRGDDGAVRVAAVVLCPLREKRGEMKLRMLTLTKYRVNWWRQVSSGVREA